MPNSRGSSGQREGRRTPSGGSGERRDRERPAHNPRDLRRSNSEDRGRSPEIDEDVTGRELDREAWSQLGSLNDSNRTWVAKHLVMAGRLIDIDPQLAFEHSLAASRRAGRLALVREAVGLAAYAAGDYAEALRELRTYRRISGDQTHLPVQADCERGLGRPHKAVELSGGPEAQQLKGAVRAELAMVVAGAHHDLNDQVSALKALEVPELNRNRAYSFSPRLYAAYAEALSALDREEEAQRWLTQIPVAEKALGSGFFESPEIMDFDEEDPQGLPTVKDLLGGAPASETRREDSGTGEEAGKDA